MFLASFLIYVMIYSKSIVAAAASKESDNDGCSKFDMRELQGFWKIYRAEEIADNQLTRSIGFATVYPNSDSTASWDIFGYQSRSSRFYISTSFCMVLYSRSVNTMHYPGWNILIDPSKQFFALFNSSPKNYLFSAKGLIWTRPEVTLLPSIVEELQDRMDENYVHLEIIKSKLRDLYAMMSLPK